jgi:hypothetical protein
METVVKQISRYQNGTKQVKEKLSRLKGARRKVSESLRVYELLAARSHRDSAEGTIHVKLDLLSDFLHPKCLTVIYPTCDSGGAAQ